MTQTSTASPDLRMQFDRFEDNLEDWLDQLTQLSPYLSPSELSKLERRWAIMRQDLDTIFLHYGRSPSRLVAVMEGLPALRELTQDELAMTLEAMERAKKSLATFTARSQKRIPLLEQALKNGEKPERLRRSIGKLKALERSFVERLRPLQTALDQFKAIAALDDGVSLLATTQAAIDASQRIEALRNANRKLADQKEQMQSWLDEARARLAAATPNPPPSPGALSGFSLALSPVRSETDKALESLFANRDALREARRYLETLLAAGETS